MKKPVLKESEKIENKTNKDIHKIKAKNILKNKNIISVTKSEKSLDYDLKNSKKTYLPKKSKKVFLPKPKKSGILKKIKNILGSEI